MNVAFTEHHILRDGRPDLLIGGEFQYFRMPVELWEPSLEKLKAAGLNTLSAYVPWIWHEPQEGTFDFSGESDPARDLGRFLALCERLELPLVVKPGPFIFAEYQGFGVPHWVRDAHPDWMMQVAKPQLHPQPALNHPGYLAAVRRWFEAVAEVIRPFVERGAVVAIQIDNETGYPQYGQGPHLSDRNPAALALLRQALSEKFSSVHELNLLWGTSYPDFEHVDPPDELECNEAQLDTLARCVEDYIVHYLANLKAMWEAIDLGCFLFLNDIWLDSWPSHIGKKNRVAPLAFDIYPRYSDLPVTLDQPFCISFVPKLFGAFLRGGPLISAEMGCGWLDPACDVSSAATWQSTMAAFAHGTQACYFYTLMDGRDPDGTYIFNPLLDVEGRPLPRLDVAAQIAHFCEGWGRDVAASKASRSRLAILHAPALTREMMSAALAPLQAFVRGSQRAIDEAMTIVSVNSGLYGALAEAGYTADVLNLDFSSVEDLSHYDVLFFNSIGVVDAAAQAKLSEFVRRGGKLVTLGTPFAEDSPLFPAKVESVVNPQATNVLLQVAWDYVKLHWRLNRQFTHRLSAYTAESMYPAMLMIKFATRTGVWMHNLTQKKGRLWASRLVTLSKLTGEARPLLTYRGKPAGYEVAVGEGVSVFLGTLLGASFDSPGFYLDAPERKRSVSDFLGHMLANWALLPDVSPIDDVETVVREGDGYRLAFLLNRGPSKSFQLSINRPWDGYVLTEQFSAFGSCARWEAERLLGTIEKDDVLCLKWEWRGEVNQGA